MNSLVKEEVQDKNEQIVSTVVTFFNRYWGFSIWESISYSKKEEITYYYIENVIYFSNNLLNIFTPDGKLSTEIIKRNINFCNG